RGQADGPCGVTAHSFVPKLPALLRRAGDPPKGGVRLAAALHGASGWRRMFFRTRDSLRLHAEVLSDVALGRLWVEETDHRAGCCARAPSGHVTALARSVMNSRRLIIRSPRRRGRSSIGWGIASAGHATRVREGSSWRRRECSVVKRFQNRFILTVPLRV